MNIEEADPEAALAEAGPMLGHVHVADNTRALPGQGCLDFGRAFRALHAIEYRGWLALECGVPAPRVLIEDHDTDLPATLSFLRGRMREVASGS
jgi:sugar phosphate isomerase/epimerase